MGPMIIGSIVSYQGRCWIISRVAGTWLHIVTATNPGHYHATDVPRAEVTQDMKSPESGHSEMFCSFRRK